MSLDFLHCQGHTSPGVWLYSRAERHSAGAVHHTCRQGLEAGRPPNPPVCGQEIRIKTSTYSQVINTIEGSSTTGSSALLSVLRAVSVPTSTSVSTPASAQ